MIITIIFMYGIVKVFFRRGSIVFSRRLRNGRVHSVISKRITTLLTLREPTAVSKKAILLIPGKTYFSYFVHR